MNSYVFNDLSNAYSVLIDEILSKGRVIPFGNGTNIMIHELENISICFKNSHHRNCFPSRTRMCYQIAEGLYVWSGRIDSYLLEEYKDAIKYCGTGYGFFGHGLGERIYNLYDDQIENVYKILKNDIHSTKGIVFLKGKSLDFIDCSLTMQYRVNRGKLELTITYRASDIIGWLQSDMYVHSIMLEMLAKWLGVETGEIYVNTPSLFIYDYEADIAKEISEQYKDYSFNYNPDITLDINNVTYRRQFYEALDVLKSWHKLENLGHYKDYLVQIDKLSSPKFVGEWLKILLANLFYRNSDFESYNAVYEYMEDTAYKQLLKYFDNNEINQEIELR